MNNTILKLKSIKFDLSQAKNGGDIWGLYGRLKSFSIKIYGDDNVYLKRLLEVDNIDYESQVDKNKGKLNGIVDRILDEFDDSLPTTLIPANDDIKKMHSILGIDRLDDDLVIQAQKMAIVYTAIWAFENSVRIFISKQLESTLNIDWWTTSVSEKIRTKAETRKTEENKIKWHTPRGDSLINYTEFGDLISIVRKNWEHFESHIVSIEWADNIIKTLERSRNVVMHSGELTNEDIERIGMAIKDWIKQVR